MVDEQFDHRNTYVADRYGERIQKFTNDGTVLAGWGSYGARKGQFSLLYGVAVDGSGNIYAVDRNLYRVQKFAGCL